MSTSKTGKHGHAKVHMVGLDIFSGKKYEDICPSTHNMDVPFVKREDYQLTDISDDGYLSLMGDNGDIREDLKLPEGELGAQLKAEYDAGKELLVRIFLCFSLLMKNITNPSFVRCTFEIFKLSIFLGTHIHLNQCPTVGIKSFHNFIAHT